jgi:signal transduction histidine kinase
VETSNETPLTHVEVLQRLARALADCEPGTEALFRCVAEHLNGSGFGFDRVAVFRDGTGLVATIPVAQHGFDDLEVLHGRLPALDRWPLFLRALEARHAIFATDAQLEGDVPLEVAGALRIRSLVGIPFVARDRCLGFAFADRGGGSFAVEEEELSVLTTVGELIASALVPAYALEQAHRLSQLKTQFVALAAHELRAPAAAIHGVTVTLRERGDDLREEQVELLQGTLYEQADRMRRLVDQLLDLSKLESDAIEISPVRIRVRERIEEILRQVAPQQLDDVSVEVDPELEPVVDPAALERILSNLIANAFRYGRPPVRVAAHQLDTHFRLWVEDRGDGVDPEFAPRLFDRFTRGTPTGDGGAGLGLAIAQSYAQAQGGRLLYEDAEPGGARFQLVLPSPHRA